MKISNWILEEISASVEAAKNCQSQLLSFRILERMTHRLGWRVIQNNPPLVNFALKEGNIEEVPEAVSEIIKKTWVDARNSGSELKALDLFSKMKDNLVGN